MTTRSSKLAAALKSRFGSPKALLRALGLDENLANIGQPGASGGGSTDVDVARAMRIDIENFLGGLQDEKLVAGLLAVMDKHVGDPKRLDDDNPQAPRARAIAAGDDDNLANVERFRAALRNANMSEEDISAALAAITRQGEAIGDKLPLNAIFGGRGGRISNNFRTPQELAGDSYNKRFPSAVIVGVGYGPTRPRAQSVRWPSDRALDDYNKRFGGEHIVTG